MVGIGASAGGFEAFTQLLSTLPADTGMAFVLVQHLEPIDYFVTSLAQSRGPRAVGVVLSGTASEKQTPCATGAHRFNRSFDAIQGLMEAQYKLASSSARQPGAFARLWQDCRVCFDAMDKSGTR